MTSITGKQLLSNSSSLNSLQEARKGESKTIAGKSNILRNALKNIASPLLSLLNRKSAQAPNTTSTAGGSQDSLQGKFFTEPSEHKGVISSLFGKKKLSSAAHHDSLQGNFFSENTKNASLAMGKKTSSPVKNQDSLQGKFFTDHN